MNTTTYLKEARIHGFEPLFTHLTHHYYKSVSFLTVTFVLLVFVVK
jgi:hypothetical protein